MSTKESNTSSVKLYGSFSTYALTVNYIVGVGILSCPFAFYAAGPVLGVIVMAFVTIVSYITMIWLLEAMARMNALFFLGRTHEVSDDPTDSYLQPSDDDDERPQENKRLINANRSASYRIHNPADEFTLENNLRITEKKFEINELVHFFLGKVAQRFYEVAVSLYIFGTLWGFVSIVGTTLSQTIPFVGVSDSVFPCDFYGTSPDSRCVDAYQIYVLFFAAIAVPMACLDISEQIFVQTLLCIFRFFAFGVMVVTTLIMMFKRPYNETGEETSPPYVADVDLIKWSGFGVLFPACVFSQLTHHSVPGLAQPIRDKSKLRQVFFFSLLTTFIFYVVVCVTLSVYFGEGMKEMATLNWAFRPGEPNKETGWYEYPIRYLVLFFPVATAVSAYPLNAITLGNNILAGLPASWTSRQRSSKWKLACRILAAVPPVICGIFVYDLAIIVQFTGLFGVFLAFVFPAGLLYSSKKKFKVELQEMKDSGEIYGVDLTEEGLKTPYTSIFSGNWAAFTSVIFGVIALVLMLAVTINPDVFGEA